MPTRKDAVPSVKRPAKAPVVERPGCVQVADREIVGTRAVVEFMVAAAVDVVNGRLTPSAANAAANCIGAATRTAALHHRITTRRDAPKGKVGVASVLLGLD